MFPCKNNFPTRFVARIPRAPVCALVLAFLSAAAPLQAQQAFFNYFAASVTVEKPDPATLSIRTD